MSNANALNCQLCCDDKPRQAMRCLAECSHMACIDCLKRWIEKSEASGSNNEPGCPFCRQTLLEADIISVLGRPFQPKSELVVSAEIDDLTMEWLRENTRSCANCGMSIEKADGCNLMECLCGYRFCFQCGAPDANCSCTDRTVHNFWDNVRDDLADGHYAPPPLLGRSFFYAANNNTGTLIDRRRHCRRIRQERERRRELQEIDDVLQESDLPGVWNGSWLFAGVTNQQSIRILKKTLESNKLKASCEGRRWGVRRQRECRRQTVQKELEDAYRDGALAFVSRWLFSETNNGTIKALGHMVNLAVNSRQRKAVQEARKYQRKNRRLESIKMHTKTSYPGIWNGSWLFCSSTKESTQRLSLFLKADSARICGMRFGRHRSHLIRQRQSLANKARAEVYEVHRGDLLGVALGAHWLYNKSNQGTLKVLNQMSRGEALIRSRKDDGSYCLDDFSKYSGSYADRSRSWSRLSGSSSRSGSSGSRSRSWSLRSRSLSRSRTSRPWGSRSPSRSRSRSYASGSYHSSYHSGEGSYCSEGSYYSGDGENCVVRARIVSHTPDANQNPGQPNTPATRTGCDVSGRRSTTPCLARRVQPQSTEVFQSMRAEDPPGKVAADEDAHNYCSGAARSYFNQDEGSYFSGEEEGSYYNGDEEEGSYCSGEEGSYCSGEEGSYYNGEEEGSYSSGEEEGSYCS